MSPIHQPLIGLTGGVTYKASGAPVCQVDQAYVNAIQKAGGAPLLIPTGISSTTLKGLLPRLDGLLFTGGADIDPRRYNGQSHPKIYGISPERDALEFALLEAALAADLPLLAICRGIQVLNVGLGGTLYAHIPDHLANAQKHDWFPGYPRDRLSHTIDIQANNLLHDFLGQDQISVNSLHHQGIKRIGTGLQPIGFAPDGLIEALEVTGASFVLGVQWHPECLPEDSNSQALFQAFIEAC